MRSLLKSSAIDYAGALVSAASNTDSNSSRFDMAGYDGVTFICTITDSVATGVATLTIETNSSDADSGMTASAAVATATSATNDDLNGMLLIAELHRPLERYVQGVRVSATANIAFGEIIAIRWCGDKSPVTQSSTTVANASYAVDA